MSNHRRFKVLVNLYTIEATTAMWILEGTNYDEEGLVIRKAGSHD